ncbi:lysis protein [Pseudomonas sp. BCA14]|uniref:lysis protein n=1 Tax=unclassified Pseudomonas TaxID=196821 RepID=UPI00106E2E6C|nr:MULTISPECIES: lysis protein [unclassified Pseudomonas]TFF13062.1 lysis protein [Pseudomonas sp. JMN1]TFF16254.1 lysis protein [Pseudomonas sp. BCA17]TFF30191.1 lysis protein [Pseudomonas sp. BCA13]TFF31032.1 lysis protein [Pseudomonas sp. BCA14]
MREGIFVLVLCLVAFFGFDLLQQQRDTARTERDAALFEASGLREAARISGEMLAERDAIDRQRTLELNHERAENDALRLDVAAGRKRLHLNATCSATATDTTGAGGLADGRAAELTDDARQDYFTLRDQLALSRQMILGLQDHVRRVCLR